MPPNLLRPRFWHGWLLAVALVIGCSPAAPPPAGESPLVCQELGNLPPPGADGVTVELAGETCHRYRVTLAAGDLLRVSAEQQTVDFALALTDSNGATLVEADRPTSNFGAELVLAVVDADGEYHVNLTSFPQDEPGQYRLQVDVRHPASEAEREIAAAYRAALTTASSSREAAVQGWREAARVFARHGEIRLEGEARFLAAFGTSFEDPARAEGFRQAADLLRRADQPGWQALAEQNLCSALVARSLAQEALAACERAATHLPPDDARAQAAIAHSAGLAHRMVGELQPALDRFEQALALWSAEDADLSPVTLHELGVLKARFLGDDLAGSQHLLAALRAFGATSASRPATLSQLGRLEYERGDLPAARAYLDQALDATGNSCRHATTTARQALVMQAQGEDVAARRLAAAANRLVASGGCPRDTGSVLLLTAELAEKGGAWDEARARHRQAEAHYGRWGDRTGVAESLAGVARAEHALGRPEAALAAARGALAQAEAVRPTVLRHDLRTTLSTSVQETYDLAIALLLDLGRDRESWAMAERTRARGLKDLLLESGAGLRRAAAPELLDRERSARRRLNDLESRRIDPNREMKADELTALTEEIADALSNLEAIRGELRRESTEYAEWIGAGPPPAAELQKWIPPDTTLLEYHLGAQQSVLWTVTAETVRAHRLPPRDELEPLAAEVAAWMKRTGGAGRPTPAACRLSDVVLGPARSELTNRLVIVADGGLEAVSFAALPESQFGGPCPQAPPVVAALEISYLPSAAVLMAVRQRDAERSAAESWLAVVADPVYGGDDPRLSRGATPEADEEDSWRRLAFTADEAAALVARQPAGKSRTLTGFEANRQAVIDGALRGHRLVHFAAHGVLDPLHPLLSRLVLSRRDPSGQPIDGALRAHEIYDLDLPSELVVLSACDTGRGRAVRGEGLQAGLPRAFLYAGASRVMVSLWPVRDRHTGDLMERFYDGLLTRRLPPSQALQEAQLAAWRAGVPPSGWAGFLLFGEVEALPPFEP
ncbi:MAG: CHAT domain-containing protein [Acidobacteriota bacterium]